MTTPRVKVARNGAFGGHGATGRAPNASSGRGTVPLFLRGPAPLRA